MVVAEDATAANNNQNKLLVYKYDANGIKLLRTHLVDFNVWGIQADVNTLYAVVDNSNELAVFQNFFTRQGGAIVPDQRIRIDDLVRTHGLYYDHDSDIMVLTDIGDAASGTDGGIIWIEAFTAKSTDNVISRSEQVVIKGAATQLGNPVDVALDTKNKFVYVAERAGNKFLAFETPLTEGMQAPAKTLAVPGISAVYLKGSTRDEYPLTAVVDVNGGGKLHITTFPNPSNDYLDIRIEGNAQDLVASNLEVYDLSGKMVLRESAQNGRARISVANLNAGMYIVYIYGTRYRYATKFTKQ